MNPNEAINSFTLGKAEPIKDNFKGKLTPGSLPDRAHKFLLKQRGSWVSTASIAEALGMGIDKVYNINTRAFNERVKRRSKNGKQSEYMAL